jgi:hypothetical protein
MNNVMPPTSNPTLDISMASHSRGPIYAVKSSKGLKKRVYILMPTLIIIICDENNNNNKKGHPVTKNRAIVDGVA